MPSLFTRIINGELPAHFVYRDERAVAFLSINPLRPGHTLVVPIEEVDHWIDADPDLNAHLMTVAQKVALAQQAVFAPVKVGLMIAGLEVPHLHIHVVPMRGMGDLDFANCNTEPDEAGLIDAASRLRTVLDA